MCVNVTHKTQLLRPTYNDDTSLQLIMMVGTSSSSHPSNSDLIQHKYTYAIELCLVVASQPNIYIYRLSVSMSCRSFLSSTIYRMSLESLDSTRRTMIKSAFVFIWAMSVSFKVATDDTVVVDIFSFLCR